MIRGSRGVTLLELMITVGLVGVSTLALMTVLANYAQMSAHRQNEANLSESLVGFSELLEAYLSNATLIISCACGPVGNTADNRCLYSDLPARDCTTAGACPAAPQSILQFEFEDSYDPSIAATANCHFGGITFPVGVTPDRLIPRGCKHRARLTYRPPDRGTAAFPQPGVLSLVPEDSQGNPAASPFFSITGVTNLWCGHVVNPARANTPSTGSFRFTIGAKARATMAGPTDPSFDSWHPLDTGGGPRRGFTRGTHRSLTTDVAFRNLNTAGIHFGKATAERTCVIDAQPDPTGNNCCSGFWDSATGTCMAMNTCKVRGVAAAHFAECCSHSRMAGSCL